jgi:cyclic lactone autoinducer peptide
MQSWHRRTLAIAALMLVAASVSGCSKCGFIWDERPASCRSDAPK